MKKYKKKVLIEIIISISVGILILTVWSLGHFYHPESFEYTKTDKLLEIYNREAEQPILYINCNGEVFNKGKFIFRDDRLKCVGIEAPKHDLSDYLVMVRLCLE